ncbi:MAG: class I SAM-dependent methyltransferase [Tannerellaceae bacterium]|jgi:SAM-dependent methyltransferase|nr:class I SAM-dependent methyltransferase [Tannerellaceae bacterium]
MQNNTNQPQCPSCGSEEKDQLFESIDIKQSRERFPIVKCRNCQLIYTASAPTFDRISQYYGKTYYSYTHAPTPHRQAENPEESTTDKQRYLDIGCGSGWHIAKKMQEGYDAYGIEIDPEVVRQCVNSGLKVKQAINGKINYESHYFDHIRLNHVLEHLHDLDSIMSEIYRCLKPAGTLQISVPNIESYDAKIYGKYWRHLDVPRHLYHFSKDTLSALLLKHHFTSLQISTGRKAITLPYIRGLYTTFKTIALDRNIIYACITMTKNIVKYLIHRNKKHEGIDLNLIATAGKTDNTKS